MISSLVILLLLGSTRLFYFRILDLTASYFSFDRIVRSDVVSSAAFGPVTQRQPSAVSVLFPRIILLIFYFPRTLPTCNFDYHIQSTKEVSISTRTSDYYNG